MSEEPLLMSFALRASALSLGFLMGYYKTEKVALTRTDVVGTCQHNT